MVSPTNLSPASIAMLEKAKEEARKRKHNQIGSEHILYAMVTIRPRNRAFHWILSMLQDTEDTELFPKTEEELESRIIEDLERRPLFKIGKERKHKQKEQNIPFSSSYQRILECARRIGDNPVLDGHSLLKNGILATEFILAAILVDGSNVAADSLYVVCRALISPFKLLIEIGLPEESAEEFLQRPSKGWQLVQLSDDKSVVKPILDGLLPLKELPDILHPLIQSPTSWSNWIIDNRLLIGTRPGQWKGLQEDFSSILPLVDVVVCLQAEAPPPKAKKYCQMIKEAKKKLIFAPIKDFNVTHSLVDIVTELIRRLRRGERLFVHCRGGHGRTGMIISGILYGIMHPDVSISINDIFHYIEETTKACRETDKNYFVEMPETDKQRTMVKNNIHRFRFEKQ